MTDFFSTRPLIQMRNAFRNADKDLSGELDEAEFVQAVRDMNTTLTDKDAKTIFAIADEDGSGTLGIDEFFVNFRHDKWPREKFFWDQPVLDPKAGTTRGDNLTRRARVELNAKLNVDQQARARKKTIEIMKVLEEKVENHGSAEKVFRVLDSNNNGSLEVNEIADAIRPYEIEIDDAQAAEVLTAINKIAGKPALTDLTYNSFALAFNSMHPPSKMGGNFEDPSSFYGMYRPRSSNKLSSSASIETIDHMRSISTLRAVPPLNHSASIGARTDRERALEEAGRTRHDMISGWRGVDGSGNEDGGQLGKTIMSTGRSIDWFEHNQKPTPQSMYQSHSMPQLTPLERVSSDFDETYNPLAHDGSQASFHERGGTANSSLSRTRSRLSIELESVGSKSTLECLYPGRASHHHIEENSRMLHTSSIASLNSISNAINGRRDPFQEEERFQRKDKLYNIGVRQASRERELRDITAEKDRRTYEIEASRRSKQALFLQRTGEQQLLKLTRGMESGKAPVKLEQAPTASWVPAAPHFTSHWASITGHTVLDDPPPRGNAASRKHGRKAFPEEREKVDDSRPGRVVWGGAR